MCVPCIAQKNGKGVIIARCNFYHAGTGRHLSSGICDESYLEDPRWYGALSKCWYEDPGHLIKKSLTCTRCGPTFLAVFFCPDSTCTFGLCYQCYSQETFGGVVANWPLSSSYSLPSPASTCKASVPHGPKDGEPDRSFILRPSIIVRLLGLGKIDKNESALSRMDDDDSSMLSGFGVYPFKIIHHSSLRQGGALGKSELVTGAIPCVKAEQLVIHISVHKDGELYQAGTTNYTAQQLFATFIKPFVQAFFSSPNEMRPGIPSALVILCCCDVDPVVWQTMFDAQIPSELPVHMLTFRAPLSLAYIPAVASGVTRQYCNLVFSGTHLVEDCIASALSTQIEQLTSPVLIRSQSPAVTDFVIPYAMRVYHSRRTPHSSSSHVEMSDVATMSSSSALSHPTKPKMSSIARNIAVLQLISSLSPADRKARKLDYVTKADFLIALNDDLVPIIAEHHTVEPFIKGDSFDKWRRQYWKWEEKSGQFSD
jgi:hypothetical protein